MLRMEVWSPAKLNLFLEVQRRREDGFHEIETLMCPVSLYDRVVLAAGGQGEGSAPAIRVTCRWAAELWNSSAAPARATPGLQLPQDDQNTVGKALRALAHHAGQAFNVTAQVIKCIPAAAGLGGGSGNAAAALLAANHLWGLRYPLATLAKIASAVGSDVPFFLYRAAAICTGRGELIQPVSRVGRLHAVIVKPPIGFSTAEVYQHCQCPQSPQTSAPLLRALRDGNFLALRNSLFNRLQPAAARISDWIERAHGEFERSGCVAHQMSGSGSSYFGISRNRQEAKRLAARMQSHLGGDVFVVTSL